MRDVIEVSYTGDLLAHRRCSRAWAYEKHVGFHPYEQVQAMEGRLVHHAMEWMTRQYAGPLGSKRHVTRDELAKQLERHFRVLWARGIRTTFTTKAETIQNIVDRLFPKGSMHPTARIAIEGAQHTEYELRAVRKLLAPPPGFKTKVLLTGILDLVIQQRSELVYQRSLVWTDAKALEGTVKHRETKAQAGDVEIWDYKGTRANTSLLIDYVRQLLTYAHLYHERTGTLPVRCVLFFINETERADQLLAVNVTKELVESAIAWTHMQVLELQDTIALFRQNPAGVPGGERPLITNPLGERVTTDLKQQCTACGVRYDCAEYRAYLSRTSKSPPRGEHADVNTRNVLKN